MSSTRIRVTQKKKKGKRTFGDDEGVAFCQGIDVQEAVTVQWAEVGDNVTDEVGTKDGRSTHDKLVSISLKLGISPGSSNTQA
jgi:hypothetical protein